MKLNKLQKRVLVVLLSLCLLTPAGILLPLFFNVGSAWGEWSAGTLKDILGYVPEGLLKYTNVFNAPLHDYTMNSSDASMVHQSGYYILSGVIGATLTYIAILVISKFIIKDGK